MLASCAGGCRADVKLPVERETVSGTKLTVSLSGLTGGHSGSEIDKGRAMPIFLCPDCFATHRHL